MYAVIKTGGKQHKVRPGDVIEVEYMDVDPGSGVEFDPILVMDDDSTPHVGKALSKARVLATLVGDTKADKIKVFKYRPKSGYKRTQGHRQRMTVLEVQEVALGDVVARKEGEQPAAEEAPPKKAPAKKASAKKAAAKKASGTRSSGKKTSAKKTSAKKSSAKRSGRKKAE